MILAVEIGEDPAHVERRRHIDAELRPAGDIRSWHSRVEGLDEPVRRLAVAQLPGGIVGADAPLPGASPP